jgi:hypothetical protein
MNITRGALYQFSLSLSLSLPLLKHWVHPSAASSLSDEEIQTKHMAMSSALFVTLENLGLRSITSRQADGCWPPPLIGRPPNSMVCSEFDPGFQL